MSVEMRKTFIGAILVGLIEKTQDIKVMKAITKVNIKHIGILYNNIGLNRYSFLRLDVGRMDEM